MSGSGAETVTRNKAQKSRGVGLSCGACKVYLDESEFRAPVVESVSQNRKCMYSFTCVPT